MREILQISVVTPWIKVEDQHDRRVKQSLSALLRGKFPRTHALVLQLVSGLYETRIRVGNMASFVNETLKRNLDYNNIELHR